MKTTIEVPDELFLQAKAIAAMRGISLKALVTEALKREVEAHPVDPSSLTAS
jgi:predicted HicB family RNase H-like nuclease